MPETAENPQMPSGAQINKTPKEGGSDNGIVCAWQHTSQASSSPARPGAPGRYPKVGVMPHRPTQEAGRETPQRARRRKLETAQADLEPPRAKLWRAGRPPRGGVGRACGAPPGRQRWELSQG
jgi:hypothetical protein